MLDIGKGSQRIGIFTFGTNYGIKKYTKNTLFDEKIGGNIHLAVGRGFPEIRSKNKSGLNWDMTCVICKNREAYTGDEIVYKNGKFFFYTIRKIYKYSLFIHIL